MKKNYPWKRFWCPREGSFSLYNKGYLFDPDVEYGDIYNPDAKPLKAFDDVPCLILLGEPGIGKSEEIRLQFEDLQKSFVDEEDQALYFELRDFQTDLKLTRDIFENNEVFQKWLLGSHQLYLFLDSLDEGTLSMHNLSAVLAKEIKKYPPERMRLRITCRTAEWTQLLESSLQERFGDANVKVLELLPLREIDVAEAARCEGVDTEKFFYEVSIKEVVPLAIKPVTLKFLFNTYGKYSRLPQNQGELYLQGCKFLCEEVNQSRLDLRQKTRLDSTQKLNLAARIAAVSMFGNFSAISRNVDLGDIPDGDVGTYDLTGEKEKGIAHDIRNDDIEETLDTGLFSSRGAQRMGWAHQTYAEFLAAYYLKLHNVPLSQQMSLLAHASSSEEKIVPQLHEVAAWAASLNLKLFREIVGKDCIVLLRSDVGTVDDKDKAALVNALLVAVNNDEVLIDNLDVSHLYHKLKHPGLANQLRSYITDKSKSHFARRLAVDIAEDCKLKELQDELVEFVLDKSENIYLRENAAYAVVRIADTETKKKLKTFVTDEHSDDVDDGLKGCALRALYPEQLSTRELFSALTYPKRSNLLGAYKSFLYTDFTDFLTPPDIVEGLGWIRTKNIGSRVGSPFSTIRRTILQEAWNNLQAPRVLEELAKTIRADLQAAHEETEKLTFSEESRIKVLNTLIPLLPPIRNHVFWLAFRRPILVRQSDFNWLLQRFFEESSPAVKECLLELLQRTFNVQDIEHTESLILASEKSPEIAKAFVQHLEPIMLDSPRARALRKQHQQMKDLDAQDMEEKNLRLTPPLIEIMKQYLEKFEAGDLAAWWHLNLVMNLNSDNTSFRNEYETDLKKLPGWKAADTETQQRILNAAREYLLKADSEQETWLGKNIFSRPAYAAYRALRLLATEDAQFIDQLPLDCWQKWSGTTVTCDFQSDEDDREFQAKIVQLAYEKAPLEIANATLLEIDKENTRGGSLYFLSRLENCWDDYLLKALIPKLQDRKLKPFCMGQILGKLLDHSVLEARNFAQRLVKSHPRSEENKERKLVAARELVLNPDNKSWATVWEEINRNNEFGHQVIQSAAHGSYRSIDSVFKRLNENQVAHLYIWLVNRYPYEEDPKYEGSWVGEPDSAREFRDLALRHLKQRGTNEAVSAIRQIQKELPHVEWLKWTLLEAQNEARRQTWKPYDPATILKIANNDDLRLVQSGEQLLAVLIESLQRLELKLHGETPAVIDLWNEIGKDVYRPKDENRLSDYIKRHFDEDLRQRGIIANREVEIRRGEGESRGERTDIHIDAVLSDNNEVYDQITVIIETKGCWNRDLWQAMEAQLKNRYLKSNKCLYGLYLVGNFNCPQWDKEDYRKKNSPKITKEIMLKKLEEQADSLLENEVLIKPFVLSASLDPSNL